MLRTLLALALGGLCLELAGQAPAGSARGEVSFRLQNSDGSPWSRADLTLSSWPIRFQPGIGRVDRVRGRANAQGIVRLSLFRGRVYRGQALETLDGARVRLSHVLDAITTEHRGPIVARGTMTRSVLVPIGDGSLEANEIRFLDRDGIHAPVSRQWSASENITLPPWGNGYYALRDRAGLVQRLGRFGWPSRPERPHLPMSTSETAQLTLRVVTPLERPLPGARIFALDHGQRSLVGITNEEGIAILDAAWMPIFAGPAGKPSQWENLGLLAEHADFADAHARGAIPFEIHESAPRHRAALVLRTKARLQTRVQVTGGRAIAASGLRLHAWPLDRGTQHFRTLHRQTRTNESGVADLRVPDREATLLVFGEPEETPSARSFPMLLLYGGPAVPKLDLDLEELRTWRIRVRGSDGVPARGAKVVLEFVHGSEEHPRLAPFEVGRTGANGECSIRLLPGRIAQLRVRTQLGLLEAQRTCNPAKEPCSTIELPPHRLVVGLLRDPEGRPLPNQRVQFLVQDETAGFERLAVHTDGQGRFRVRLPRGVRGLLDVGVPPRATGLRGVAWTGRQAFDTESATPETPLDLSLQLRETPSK